MSKKQVFEFHPVGLDLFEKRSHLPPAGARVVKVQPAGCPKNGTMGHTFIAHADSEKFIGLVLVKSLKKVS